MTVWVKIVVVKIVVVVIVIVVVGLVGGVAIIHDLMVVGMLVGPCDLINQPFELNC